MGLTDSAKLRFKQHHLKRMKRRKHHPCPRHGNIKHVCEDCVRTVCPKCGHDCVKDGKRAGLRIGKRKEDRMANPVPVKDLQPVWEFMQSLGEGALFIEQMNADWIKRPAYWACFTPNSHGRNSMSDLASYVRGNPDWKKLTDPVSGVMGDVTMKPLRWRIAFHSKKIV